MSHISVRLAVYEQTEVDEFHLGDGDAASDPSLPDTKSVWLYGTLTHVYPDDTTVRADCYVTWERWLLIGNAGVKASLRDEVKKARRRQLREGVTWLPHKRAVTFVLR